MDEKVKMYIEKYPAEIDEKQTSYDDVEERLALEQAAKQLFGFMDSAL